MLSYSCRWAHTYKNISQGLWHSPSLSPHLHSNKKKKKKRGGDLEIVRLLKMENFLLIPCLSHYQHNVPTLQLSESRTQEKV